MVINNENFPDVGIRSIKFCKPCRSLDVIGVVEFESGAKCTVHAETYCECFAMLVNSVIAYAESHDDGDEEPDELTPEEARIRYYESQADIAREEADDGE